MPLWPESINGIPLSERSQWLLFAPMWMLFPEWRKRVLHQPITSFGLLRPELRLSLKEPSPEMPSVSVKVGSNWVHFG